MEQLDEIFWAAMMYLMDEAPPKRVKQVELAKQAGISPTYLNDIRQRRNLGSDDAHRKIAAALGYPDRKYEEFLDIGRAILAGRPASAEPEIEPAAPAADIDDEVWDIAKEPPSEEDLFLARPPEFRYFYYALDQLLPGRDKSARAGLAERLRIKPAVLDRLLDRRDQMPEPAAREKIAAAFDMTLDGFLFVGRRIDEEVSLQLMNAFPETVINLPEEDEPAEGDDLYDLILNQPPARPGQEAAARPVPMLGLAHCGRKGWNSVRPISVSAAPITLGPRAFAVAIDGLSMRPEGFGPGMICYCDPDQPPLPGDAVYIGLQQAQGGNLGSLKQYLGLGPQVDLPAGWVKVRGWDDPDKRQHQKSFVINIPPSQIVLLATVIYVRRRV